MKNFIKNRLRETLIGKDERDICDDFSPKDEAELLRLIANTDQISSEQRKEVDAELAALRKANKELGNDADNFNTAAHKIGTTLCSKRNPKNLD